MEIHLGFRSRSAAWHPHILRRGVRAVRGGTPRRVVVLEGVGGPVLGGGGVRCYFRVLSRGGRCHLQTCTAREPVVARNMVAFVGSRKCANSVLRRGTCKQSMGHFSFWFVRKCLTYFLFVRNPSGNFHPLVPYY